MWSELARTRRPGCHPHHPAKLRASAHLPASCPGTLRPLPTAGGPDPPHPAPWRHPGLPHRPARGGQPLPQAARHVQPPAGGARRLRPSARRCPDGGADAGAAAVAAAAAEEAAGLDAFSGDAAEVDAGDGGEEAALLEALLEDDRAGGVEGGAHDDFDAESSGALAGAARRVLWCGCGGVTCALQGRRSFTTRRRAPPSQLVSTALPMPLGCRCRRRRGGGCGDGGRGVQP